MRPISFRFGRNSRSFRFTSSFLMWFSVTAMPKAMIWPMTVAMAAPFAPWCSTNMNIGSSMRLMIAPMPWVNMV